VITTDDRLYRVWRNGGTYSEGDVLSLNNRARLRKDWTTWETEMHPSQRSPIDPDINEIVKLFVD
jgi:hypothetical protein